MYLHNSTVCVLCSVSLHACIYRYLRNESASNLHSASQGAERFAEVCNSLDLVGFEADMQNSIFACLAAILHLGNIQFQEDGNEYSYVLDPRCGPINTVAVRICIGGLWLRSAVFVEVGDVAVDYNDVVVVRSCWGLMSRT